MFDTPEASEEFFDRSSGRRRMVEETIQSVAACFPQLEFQLLDSITGINAHASVLRGQRTVGLFGGLAFNRLVGEHGLRFSLLHESGHHLGSGARLALHSPLACECAADQWAVTTGRRALAKTGCALDPGKALDEIEAAASAATPIEKKPNRRRRRCWAFDWTLRRRALTDSKLERVRRCNIRTD